jgi:hypothetical protein
LGWFVPGWRAGISVSRKANASWKTDASRRTPRAQPRTPNERGDGGVPGDARLAFDPLCQKKNATGEVRRMPAGRLQLHVL